MRKSTKALVLGTALAGALLVPTPAFAASSTGLYGRYRLKMQKSFLGAGATGVIENELP